MKSFYELLLKVGTNPQLRAWAAKQMINLKSLRSGYKDSFQHSMDKNKIKDIMDPKWIDKEHTAKIAYNLKNKVLDITKAKDKIQWLKDQASLNKARFEGKNFRGWVDDSVKKIGDDMNNFFKKDIAQNKWFNKTLKKSLDGNKKSKLEIDKYFKNIEKIDKEKVVPFWPRKKPYKVHKKADGGRIGFNKGSKGGIGALLTHLYRLSEISPLLASPELVDLIQKIPFKEGGLAGMLGEPRSGYNEGGYMGYWKMVQDKYYEVKEIDPEKFGNMSIQDFAKEYYPRPGQAEGGRIGYKHGSKKSRINKKLPIKFPVSPLDQRINELWEKLKLDKGVKDLGKKKHAQGGRIGLADGDTPSEAYLRDIFFSIPGGDQLGSISFQEWKNSPSGQHYKDKWIAEHRPKLNDGGRIGYDNGGPTIDVEHWAQLIFQKPYDQLTPSQQEHITSFKPEKAEGGRIGFKDGEGIMSRTGDMVDIRNVPYYAGEGLKGLVNSAETLSKLPLAAGKLTSDLIQKQGFKRVPREKSDDEMTELFMQQTGQDYKLKPTDAWGKAWGEALENITPGSWSENLGLTSLVEGMGEKRPKDAQTVGGILGLGTEIAVPTGGAFKAGQLLLSKASKAMGKVKDGKTLEKLVDEKLTDSGQSRRDFNIMAATGSLVGALKWLGLGGILKTTAKLKPTDDVVITLRTFIDDSDVWGEAGPVATGKFGGILDIESLSTGAQKTLKKISDRVDNKGFGWSTHRTGHNKGIYEDVPLEDGAYVADFLKKAGHKVRLEHLDDVGGGGRGVDDILDKFKNDPMYKGTKEGAEHYKKFSEKVKKMTEREKFEYHNSLTDDYHNHYSGDVEDLLDVLMPVKKAEGGRIGLAGGTDFQRWLEGKQKFDIEQNREELYKEYLEDKRRQKVQEQKHMAADGGRIGLQTGGPPITLQRPMFNDGGLTKTIPPERGPDPQGLPSALYNGIMRPRSY